MRLSLQRHSLTPVSGIDDISVTYEWLSKTSLWLRYHAEGQVDDISLPGPADPDRADNLWQTTCFELFLKEAGKDRYHEFNFSPSSQWAVYQFAGYREAMSNLPLPTTPEIFLDFSDSHFALEVTLDLPDIWGPDKSRNTPLDAGFSAVIAERDGQKSYWALAHPQGQPDFHHGDCFAHQLKAANKL